MTDGPGPSPQTPRPSDGSDGGGGLADATVDLALARALRLRLLGALLVVTGVVVALAVVLAATGLLPSVVVGGLLVLALVEMVLAGVFLGVRRWVLRLDQHGYRVRFLRSAQARSARWTDVLDLQASQVAGSRCVVLRLRDGRTTTLPVDVIEGDPEALTRLLSRYLDRGHGYTRLR